MIIAYDNSLLDYFGVSVIVSVGFFVLLASLILPFRERKESLVKTY